MMRVIVDPPRGAAEQMALDERLALEAAPTLRLFRWDPPAFSLGWRQTRPTWLDARVLRESGLELVERPTGGGLACHGSDLSCAVVIPRGDGQPIHQLMAAVCEAVVEVARSFGVEASALLEVPGHQRITVCLSEPSSYAVLTGERKLAGFALRRYPDSWLIHGSLLVRPLPAMLLEAMPGSVSGQVLASATSLSEAAGTLVWEQEVAVRLAERWSTAHVATPEHVPGAVCAAEVGGRGI